MGQTFTSRDIIDISISLIAHQCASTIRIIVAVSLAFPEQANLPGIGQGITICVTIVIIDIF